MNDDALTFKQGTIFRHGRWLEQDSKEKAICRVTAIRYGLVYYGFGINAKKARYHTSPESLIVNGATTVIWCCDCGESPASTSTDNGETCIDCDPRRAEMAQEGDLFNYETAREGYVA